MVFPPPATVTLFSVTVVSVEPAPLIVIVAPRKVTAFVAAIRVGFAVGFRPKLSQFNVP